MSAALRELLEKATPVEDWSWDNMRVDADGEVYVPECSYLGPTAIALASTYENSGNDCAYIAAALNALPALLAKSAAYEALVARCSELAAKLDRQAAENYTDRGNALSRCADDIRLLVSDDRPSHTAGENDA